MAGEFVEDTLFADTAAPICLIPSSTAFAAPNEKEQLYTYHMCRAAFYGTRIVLRQTSQESETIYNLLSALYEATEGNWEKLADTAGIARHDLDHFLDYACMFLANLGNYRVS